MNATIELNEPLPKPGKSPKRGRTWRYRLGVGVLKLSILGAAMYGTGAASYQVQALVVDKYEQVKERILSRLVTVEVVKEYLDPIDHSTDQLIEIISAEQGIDPVITAAIIEKESSYQNASIRTEPRLCAKMQAETDAATMLCSSHGLMQILGIEARRQCKIDWSQLYDRRTNIRCGLTILKNNLAAAKGAKTPGRQLREALRMYNGRGEDAERYADSVMSNIADKLISKNNKGE